MADAFRLLREGRVQEFIQAASGIISKLREIGKYAELSKVQSALVDAHFFAGQFQEAERVWAQSIKEQQQQESECGAIGEAKLLATGALLHLYQHNVNVGEKYAREARERAKAIEDTTIEVQALNALAFACILNNELTDAVVYADESLEIAGKQNYWEGQGYAFLRRAAAHSIRAGAGNEQSEINQAFNDAESAFKDFQSIDDHLGKAWALNEIANLQLRQKNVFMARATVLKIFTMFPTCTHMIRFKALETLVSVYIVENDLTSALRVTEEEYDRVMRQGNLRMEFRVLQVLIRVRLLREEPEDALIVAMRYLEVTQSLEDHHAEGVAWQCLSEAFLASGRTEEALQPGKEAVALLQKLGNEQEKARAMRQLSEVYVVLERPCEAPNRVEALTTLKELAKAVKDQNKDLFLKCMDEMNAHGGYSEADLLDGLLFAADLDRESLTQFLLSVDIKVDEYVNTNTIKFCDTRRLDLAMRISGMSFGPEFRRARPCRLEATNEKPPIVLVVGENYEDGEWEKAAVPQHLFDSILQTRAVFNFDFE